MKNNFIIKCLVVLGINVSTLFNAATTNAQIDVLDLWTNPDSENPIMGCLLDPNVLINVNIDETGFDTVVVIRNKLGYRYFDDAPAGDQQYKFSGQIFSECGAASSGEFHIAFKSNGSFVGIKQLSFRISSNFSPPTVMSYKGGIPTPGNVSSTLGLWNRYKFKDEITPFDSIIITVLPNAGYNTSNLFALDSLLMRPIPQGSMSANGPFCATGTGQLTWTATSGTGPYTVIYNDGTANRTANGVNSGTAFNVFTNPVTGTTNYTLVSVTDANDCVRSSGFSGGSAIITVNPLPVTGLIVGGPGSVCSGSSTNITVSGSVSGTTYQLRNDAGNINVGSPVAGTGGVISLPTGNLTASNTFNVLATIDATGCFAGLTETETVTVNQLINNAGTITGTATVSQGQSGVSYSTSAIDNASDYIWSYTGTGATISGTTNSVTIDFSVSATSGNLTVRGSNSCGSGPVSTAYPINVSGGGPGVLLPEIVCLLDLSWSMNRDFYDHTTSDPNAVKLKLAKNSLAAFVDLLYHNNPDDAALGLVRFPNSPQVNCDAGILDDIQTLDNQYHLDLASEIPLLIADGNSTPLLAGIDTAINMLEAPVKKIIVLLTDGRQNCPNTNLPVLINNTKAALTGALIKLYTIGFGAPGIVPNDMLNDIATTSGGLHYNIADEPEKVTATAYDPSAPGAWDPATALDAAYSHIIVEGLGLSYITDPLAIISSGTKVQYDIPVSALDERICFFVSWVTPQENYLGVKLFTPAGAELSPGQAGILTTRRSNHTIITLTGELLNKPGMTGLWKLEIDGSGIANNSEHYQYSVINTARKLDVKTWFEKDRYFTGDKMKIFLEVLLDGKAITSFDKLSIQGTQPKISLGNWLSSKRVDKNMIEKVKQNQLEEYLKLLSSQPQFASMNNESKERYLSSQKENFLISIDPVELRVHALMNNYKLRLPERIAIKGLRFTDDGKNGDQKAGDGRYTATFVPKQEGSFILNTSIASTIKEQKVIRETHLQTYVSTRFPVKPVFKKIRLIEKTLKGENIYDIIFSLKDRYGNIPMPDAINNLTLSVDKGILAGGITDNMDGTFTQRISLPESINPKKAIMTLSSYGVSRSRKIASNNSIGYLLAGLVLAVISAVTLLRKNKKN